MSTPHDIMVSYSWGQKPLVTKIVEHLRTEGYTVWMDESGIKDFLATDIANAINEATVVLICLSQSYQDSESCKKEGGCIDHYKKPYVLLKVDKYNLNDWVAGQFSGRRYINIFDEATFETQFQDLLRILQERFPDLVRNPATGAQANQIGPQSLTSNTGQYEGYNRPLQPQAPSQVQHQAHPQVPSSGSTFGNVAGNVNIGAGSTVGGVHYNFPSGDQTDGQQVAEAGAGSTFGGVHSNPAPSGDQTHGQGCRLSQNALLFISREVGADWQLLGRYLGLKMTDVEKIKSNKHESTELAIMKMLETWQTRRSNSEHQLELMCKALNQYGNVMLADDLREKIGQNEF